MVVKKSDQNQSKKGNVEEIFDFVTLPDLMAAEEMSNSSVVVTGHRSHTPKSWSKSHSTSKILTSILQNFIHQETEGTTKVCTLSGNTNDGDPFTMKPNTTTLFESVFA
jgi:hypothetical protein